MRPSPVINEAGVAVRAWVIDRFEHPTSGRRARTVRTELSSATREISRRDASLWCARVRDAVHSLWPQEE